MFSACRRRFVRSCTLGSLAALMGAAVAASPVCAGALTVRYDHPLHAVSPMLYGLMTEEINHSYDGGLYAQLIRDRVFFRRERHQFVKIWSVEQNAEDGISLSIDEETDPSGALPYSLKLTAAKASPKDPAGSTIPATGACRCGRTPPTMVRSP